MVDLVPLNHLPTGERGRVSHILGRPEHVQRMREMGIRDGVEIFMVRSGSPCIVRIGLHTLCVRGNELLNVLVQAGSQA